MQVALFPGTGVAGRASVAIAGLIALAPLAPPVSAVADEWTPVTLEGSADCAALVSAPSLPSRYYLATAEGGVYRSDDRGDAWSLAMDGLPLDGDLRVLAVSPVDPDFVLLGGALAEPVHRSDDGAGSWTAAGAGLGALAVNALAFDPSGPDTVLAGGESGATGIYRSTDGGLTWTSPSPGLASSVLELAFHPATPGLVLAAAGDGVHRSTDGGRNWTHVYSGGHVSSVSWGPAGSGRAWGVFGSAEVLRSDDEGMSFTTIATISFMRAMHRVRAHPGDPDRAFVGGSYYCDSLAFRRTGKVQETTDGGATWTSRFESGCSGGASPRVVGLLYEPGAPERLTVAVRGRPLAYGSKAFGLHLRDDTGWSAKTEGLSSLAVAHVETDLAGGLWYRGGKIWQAVVPESTAASRTETLYASYKIQVDVFSVNPTHPEVVHDAGKWNDIDVSGTWAKTNVDGATTPFWYPFGWAPFEYDGFGPVMRFLESGGGSGSRMYAAEAHYDLYRTQDDGANWTNLGSPFSALDAAVDPGDNQRLFVLTEEPAGVQLSTDAGVTWTPRSTGLPSGTPLRIHLDLDDSDHLLAVYETDGLWETTDAGLSWSELGTGPPAATIVASDWDAPANRVFLATEAQGVWITGHGWANDGLGTRRLEDIAYSVFHETVIVGTELFGAWRLPYPRGPVGIASLDAPGPTKLSLDARPNPFRRDVTLRFALPVAGPVRLEVLDVTGRRVRSLADGVRAAGAHRETWDARDDRGKRVGAGIYFARIAAGDEREVVRITLLR